MEQEEECRRLTLEALDDVDAGRVIDHQTVQEWAESLGTEKLKTVTAVMKLEWTSKFNPKS
jgi:hypothetical protein